MKKKFWIIFGCLMAVLVAFPTVMDHWIIGNNVPSNITNESWVSFFGGYFGAIITGLATFIAFYFTFFQSEKQNNMQKRLTILPYLDVNIDEPGIDYSEDKYLLLHPPEGVLRAMVLSTSLQEYCGEYVYGFLESTNHSVIYENVIYPHVEKIAVENKAVGVQLKEVKIRNIGLNSAVAVAVYLNRIRQWQFNLEKDSVFSFYYVLDRSMFNKRIDIDIAFKDLLGNEYIQQCFVITAPTDEMTGETFQKSITGSPVLKKGRETNNALYRGLFKDL